MISVNNDDLKVNKQSTDTSSTQVQVQSEGEKKATIFENMTRAQAEEAGLLDAFNKVDENHDNTISNEELTKYNNTPDDNTNTTQKSQSGKRVAQGGIYTVQKGDSLSKIAQDFNLDMWALYEVNKNVIGKNINILQVGQQINVSGVTKSSEDNNKTDSTSNSANLQVFAGMTKEQAEKIGGETLKTFNEISADGKSISPQDFNNYKRMFMGSLTSAQKEALKNLDLSDPKNLPLVKKMIAKYSDKAMWDHDYSNKTAEEAITELFKQYNITEEDLQKEGLTRENINQNPEAFGRFVYSKMMEHYKADVSNKDGDVYKTQYERLKRGEFTDYEKQQLGLQGQLNEEQLDLYTQLAIKQKYIGTAVSLNIDTEKGEKAEYLAAMVQAIGNQLIIDDPSIKAFVTALGIEKLGGTKYQAQTAEMVAANTKAYGIYEGDEASSILGTKAIIESGSTEAIDTLIKNNSDQIDLIKDVAKTVIDSMPEGSAKDAIRSAVNNAVTSVESGTKNSGSAQNIKSTTQSVVSNPILNNKGYDVNVLAQKSHEFIRFNTVSPQQTRKEKLQQQQQQIAQQAEELHRKMGVAIEGLKNKPPEKALSIVFSHYNQMPDNVKSRFLNYLTRQFNEHPDALCEIYLKGDNTVRQFLNQQHIMSVNDIYKHLDEHPEDLKYADKTTEVNYKAYKSKSLLNKMTPPSDFDQKASKMSYNYWPDLVEGKWY